MLLNALLVIAGLLVCALFYVLGISRGVAIAHNKRRKREMLGAWRELGLPIPDGLEERKIKENRDA